MRRRARPARPAIEYGVESVLDLVTTTFALTGTQHGNEFTILCPNPRHVERNPSCGVNLDTGYWHCLACGVGGDIVELGSLVLGRPADEIEDLVDPGAIEGLLTRLQGRLTRLQGAVHLRRPRPPRLPDHNDTPDFTELHERGFTDATIARHDFRYVDDVTLTGKDGKTYTIRHSIAIPIYGPSGEVLSWCYRATRRSPSWQPRYLYTPGTEISELWYGLNLHGRADEVTVVEGALDAAWTDQCGHPALGMLGAQMGSRKLRKLLDYKRIYLLGDLDVAGLKWVRRVGEAVGGFMPVMVCQYRSYMMKKRPEADGSYRRAKDPEELTPVDLELVHATAVPYAVWRMARSSQVG